LKCGSTINRDIPSLPLRFTTGIEFTIVEKNYSAVLREVYDYDNNRLRFDYTSAEGSVTAIYFLNEKKQYTIMNQKNCTSMDLPTTNASFHIPTTAHFFQFGAGFEEHYQGVYSVRGIPCDVWLKNISSVTQDKGQNITAKYSVYYSFSVQEWKMRGHNLGSNTNRIPVQCEIAGEYVYTNGTKHEFHHYYDFVDFNTDDVHNSSFQPQLEWNCPGWTAAKTDCEKTVVDRLLSVGLNGGGAFGLWLLGFVLGSATVGGIVFCVMKRRLNRADYQRSLSKDVQNEKLEKFFATDCF